MRENTHETPPSSGLTLNDIYFVLFRRKWLILSFLLLGVAIAAYLFLNSKSVFQSESKLLVRYVVEDKSLVPVGTDGQVKSPDSRGDNIINSEIEILTSRDLCLAVAEAVGPALILESLGGGNDQGLAAAVIAAGIRVDVPRKSNIIRVIFEHSNKEVVRAVLPRLVDEYLKRHAEVHRGLGLLDVALSRQTDEMKARLNETEEALRKLKQDSGIVSIEETRNAYIQERFKLRGELFNTEAALAEAKAALALAPTNAASSTNGAVASEGKDVEVPADTVNQYQVTMKRLAELRDSELNLRLQFSDENALVKRARERLTEVDQQRKDLETQFPGLLKVRPIVAAALGAQPIPAAGIDPSRVLALEAKLETLRKQLENIRVEIAKLDEIETPLNQLQRRRDLEETNFRYFSASLERSRFDEALGAGRNSNINVIQNATPPRSDDSRRMKMAAGALAGGLALGLGLAFLLEMFVDQSVRRVADVDARLGLPLFMAIPRLNGKAMRTLSTKPQKRLATNGRPEGPPSPDAPVIASTASHPLRPTFEALRDRTLLHLRGVEHRPKLVGISSCSDGGGVTTMAAGLAAALSETGEGKVLLVDMQQPQGAAHPFFKGKHACEIEDVLGHEKREAGMVQENLYVATTKNGHDRKLGALAKHLSSLVPRFRASDYDFIIFDMPRVSPTSVTLRLSAMMDLVLLVAESEKVPRQALRHAHELLQDAGTDAQVVLNKVRSHVPARLSGEL